MARIGVLALQGDYVAHGRALERLGRRSVEVRRAEQLDGLDGLVLPGGESTTLLNLMQGEPWFESLRRMHERGGAFLATCAGAILLSREVVGPAQPSVGLLDAVIVRNGYGRQIDSFETPLAVEGWDRSLTAVFIRAPRFREIGPAVRVLARVDGEPVLIRQGSILAATFHPELTEDSRLHRLFLGLAEHAAPAGVGPAGAPRNERRVSC